MKILIRKIRVALTPRSWLLKTVLSNGAIVYGKNCAGFGGQGIYIYRDAIEPELQHLEEFLDSSGVFVDVGASTGVYTIKAAKHFGNTGIVLAIEPFLDVLATLFYSIQMNHFTNVRLRNFCAGECTGSAKFWMNSDKPNAFSLIKREKTASYLSTMKVALDDLLKWEDIDSIDYLKIDAEGSERQVIEGARKLIEKYRPIIQMETIEIDASINFLSNYSVFRAPHSPNMMYIPNESSKIQIPKRLGWNKIFC